MLRSIALKEVLIKKFQAFPESCLIGTESGLLVSSKHNKNNTNLTYCT